MVADIKKSSSFTLAASCSLVHPLLNRLFVTSVAGVVIALLGQGVGQMLLVNDCIGMIVGVLIAFAVAQTAHQFARGIPQVERYREGAVLLDIAKCSLHSRIRSV